MRECRIRQLVIHDLQRRSIGWLMPMALYGKIVTARRCEFFYQRFYLLIVVVVNAAGIRIEEVIMTFGRSMDTSMNVQINPFQGFRMIRGEGAGIHPCYWNTLFKYVQDIPFLLCIAGNV